METIRTDRWQEAVQQLLAVRRPAQAEQLVRRRLATYPQDAYAHVLLAFTLLRQQRETEAIDAAENALSFNPAESEAYYLLALALARKGKVEAAQNAIRQALRLNSVSSKYLGIQAWLLNALNRSSEAQAAAEAGLSYDPTHVECLTQLANALRNQQQWSLLQACLRQLVKAHPQLPLAHKLLGEEALRQEHFAEAQAHFEAVLRLAPDEADAHKGLTRALRYQFGPGRLARRLDVYMTSISEGTKKGQLRAWGHFLLIWIPLSLLCVPILLFVGFEAVYWRLHPQVRQLRNRPADAPSYLHESLHRYGTIASAILLVIALLPSLIWIILKLGVPESALGPGLTGGLTALIMGMGQALKTATDMPLPTKSPVGWLLVAFLSLAATLACTFSSLLWPWSPPALLLCNGVLLYWRIRSLRHDSPNSMVG
ncbi:tetratricopeptide repeat protein [Hymenobacter volaticus]|uniref:Tetratricopeptide repeat protein n=1 Tax=Hymenobacter volaticus TaxID=2932254 RepID=A0ABY4G867_9BACT|nr:tetratricopeptide repeat protein [Hymenobacter volaticus]UOQ67092.1 tetratricopeptide repeat protein [Hymenobacter volaticus]